MFGSKRKEPKEHDPAEAIVREVGAQLRQARQARGEELEDVAEFLRIRPTYLYGLEQGDLSVIPGRTYALGFLRSYARYLGFDGDELIAQIRSSVADLTGAAPLYGRTPLSESRLPKLPILVISVAALAGVYVGWAWVDDSGRTESELVAEVPEGLRVAPLEPVDSQMARLEIPAAEVSNSEILLPELTEPVIEPVVEPEIVPAIAPNSEPDAATAPPEGAETVPVEAVPEQSFERDAPSARSSQTDRQESVVDEPEFDRVEPAPAAVPAGPEVAALDQPAAGGLDQPTGGQDQADAAVRPAAEVLAGLEPVDDGVPSPAIYRIGDAPGRVILHARSRAWVHVSSTNNDLLWVKTLQPGEAVVVPDRPDLVLWTGNAGGIEVVVDGTPLPPLGPDAGVVRDVPLRPEALRSRLAPALRSDAESRGL